MPNSIALAPPHGVLVTGSNMSGKSTFLRTVGVNAVLAQTINTCLARAYDAPVYQVRSCIGRADDLIAGKSYYLVEVESVLALVRASEGAEPHLFIFDELFRGTNAVERIAAAEAVLGALIGDGKPHVVLAATHDGELVDLLRDSYVVCHFGDAVGPEGLVFDYRLTSGPATSRNAISLLKLNGAPETIVNRALARAEALDRQRRQWNPVPANEPSVLIEFSAPTSLLREQDRPSQLPIVGNGPPGTFVVFPSGLRVSLPTDQIVLTDDSGGHARVGFGGMRFVGSEGGRLTFVRVREMFPEDQLSPDRSHTMRLDPQWVAAISVDGRRVWPDESATRARKSEPV